MSRVGLQLIAAVLYSICIPSKWVLFAIPSLLFTARFNIHAPLDSTTALLNSTLQSEDYVLRRRQDSLTGYLSVLESKKERYRVMRCDHSLLGGEWIPPPEIPKPIVHDPIYAIFTMLEAVRLIKSDGRKPNPNPNALNIGLGIGTTPAAFLAHGVNTTVVEIDPAVSQLATQYFGYPSEPAPVIDDAVGFVEQARKANPVTRYDYIVHDVFTGGVEPESLFTLQFMQGLHDLLKDDGAIAINYAGDLALPSAGLIVRTILAAFPTCRVFREGEMPSTTSTETPDFTNMVIFCKKSKSPLEFRKPVKADYLGSMSREMYLLPKHEVDRAVFQNKQGATQDILEEGQLSELQSWHFKSAVGHWKLMRNVMPASIWEKW